MISIFLRNSLFILWFVGFYACSDNKFDVNIDKKVDLEIVRFDQELMQVDTSEIQSAIDVWYQKYPIFFPTYTYGVLGIGGREQKEFSDFLISFVSNSITQEVYQEIQKQFPDVSDVKSALEDALSHYNYYFPSEQIPTVYFFQSGFNQRIIVDSLVLGVALDMCLGADNHYYKQLALPPYIAKKMNKDAIALDAMRAFAWSNFTFKGDDNLASNMVYEGKIQYLLDALFPTKSDAEKLSYSEKEIQWLEANKEDIWSAIIQEEMLYQTDRMKIKNMIKDAPFTQSFGNKSPSKIGVWLGWEIVKSYMDEHPKISLQDLMHNDNYIEILNESNYKP